MARRPLGLVLLCIMHFLTGTFQLRYERLTLKLISPDLWARFEANARWHLLHCYERLPNQFSIALAASSLGRQSPL